MSTSLAENPASHCLERDTSMMVNQSTRPLMLHEFAVVSELFGEIPVAGMLAVEAAVNSNDQVRSRYPRSVVEAATRKVHADTIHCIAESTHQSSILVMSDPVQASVYLTGNEQSNVSQTDDMEDEPYDPFADDDAELSEEADELLVAQALKAQAVDQIQADKVRIDNELALRVVAEDFHGRGERLGRRERAFVLAALTEYDPVEAQRKLAEELYSKPTVIEPPAREVPHPEALVGYDTLRGKLAINAGYLVARTTAAVQHLTWH